MARQHVKMVLSGDGGDENFAGYNSYEYVINRMRDAPIAGSRGGKGRWFRELAGMTCGKMLRASFPKPLVDELYEHQSITARHFSPASAARAAGAVCAGRGRRRSGTPRPPRSRRRADRQRLQHLDLMAYLPFDILTKVDVAAMANSLEVRVPLLDHHVVELAATMPSELKLKPVRRRLRQEAHAEGPGAPPLSVELIDRPNMGFGVPIGDWMAGNCAPRSRSACWTRDAAAFFDMTRSPASGSGIWPSRQTARIWNLLFLDEWLNTHQDAVPAHASR